MEDGRKLYRSQIDYGLPLLDETILSSDYQTYYPLNSCKDNSNPLQFNIKGNSSFFIDPFNSYLYCKVSIKRQDGTKLDSTDTCAPGNLFLHMLIKNCEVYVNNNLVSDSSNFYSYAAWINTQLSLGQGEKCSQLTSEMYYKDIDPDNNDPANESFKKRQEFAKESKIFEVLGKLHTGLFQQRRYLPPNTDITIILTRNSPEYALSSNIESKSGISGSPYMFFLEDCILYVRKHQLSQAAASAALKNSQKFNFPYRRSEIRNFSLPIGSISCSGEVLFNGKIPDAVLIGIVDSTAYAGRLTKSPMNFQPYGLTSIGLTINDITYRALKLDYDNGIYLLAYRSILMAEKHNDIGNDIDRKDYTKGSCLYMFDLKNNVGGAFQPQQTGQVKLDLQFKSQITQSLVVIVYGQFQSLIQIDHNGSVSHE